MYQISRPLGLIWSDLLKDNWFRIGLVVKLALMILLAPVIQQEWFLPFLLQFFESPSITPWTDFIDKGGAQIAFPYGPAMLFSHLPMTGLGWLLDQLFGSEYFLGLGFRFGLLVADLFILLTLLQQFDSIWGKLIIYYWLSPLVLFITYWHGQLDLIPVALFFVAVSFLRETNKRWGGVLLALSVAAKHSMLIGVPFIFIYLWLNRGLKSGLKQSFFTFFITLIAMEVPLCFTSGFIEMVIRNRETFAIFWFTLNVGGIFIYVTPITYMLLLYYTLRMRRMNFDLLFATLGVAFSIIIILIPAPPGWLLWLAPIYALHQSKSSGGAVPLVSIFSLFFIFYSVLYSEGAQFLGSNLLVFQDANELGELFPGKYKSLLYTTITGLGLVIGLQILREGIQGNDYYHLGRKPLVLGIAGDSGVGKTTFAGAISDIFGDLSCVHLIGDDYHKWDRTSSMWKSMTHLDPRANNIYKMVEDLRNLLNEEAVGLRTYSHKTGRFSIPQLKKSRNIICVSGLHAFFTDDLSHEMDKRFYLEMDEELRVKFKIKRDVEERGRNKELVLSDIERRKEDFKLYVRPQSNLADVVFSLMPANPELLNDDLKNIKFGLRVKLKQGYYYDSLSRALIGICGLNVNINNFDYKGGVDFNIQGEVAGEDIFLAAQTLLPHFDELINPDYGFRGGMLGIMQLISVAEINEALMVRRRSYG